MSVANPLERSVRFFNEKGRIMDEQLKAIEDLRRLGILITPPSERVRFPFREFHVIGHTTLDSNELRHGDHWYLYENVGKKPLLVEVKWADSSGQSSENKGE
ncbi:MAG: hypothetical protein IM321_02330 [Microcystis sp. M010S1]|nr:hypothetical protein [Microcystis sp. M010S1]